MGSLLAQRGNIDACVRCGLCLEVCPTYRLTQLEEESPRGRIALAKALAEGHLSITNDFVQHQLSCLLCEGCTSVCPAGVRMEEIGVAVRARLAADGALPARTRAVRRLLRMLGDRERLERSSRRLRRAQRFGLIRLASATRLLRLFGLSGSSVPVVPKSFVEPDGGGWRPRGGATRGRVSLFVGCVMSTLLAPTDVATGELLAAAGFEVEITTHQTCCGALAAHLGDVGTAIEFGRRNVAAFHGSDDPIVVNSAGCGAFLKEYGVHLGLEGIDLASRVIDFNELLADLPLDLTDPRLPGPVAYQDPCHARLAQGIVDAPRRLLSRIPGVRLVEIDDPEICCGSAGVYNITNRAESRELADRKARAIVASGAAMVVTSNPGCLLQVQGALREVGTSIEVRHIADVLRAACRTEVETIEASSAGRPAEAV